MEPRFSYQSSPCSSSSSRKRLFDDDQEKKSIQLKLSDPKGNIISDIESLNIDEGTPELDSKNESSPNLIGINRTSTPFKQISNSSFLSTPSLFEKIAKATPPVSPHRTPKVCPPTPSPIRSVSRSPHMKRIKGIPSFNPDGTDELDGINDQSAQQPNEIDHHTNIPQLTFSNAALTPPSSPPHSPPIELTSGLLLRTPLKPPPCNINPFSPERTKSTDTSVNFMTPSRRNRDTSFSSSGEFSPSISASAANVTSASACSGTVHLSRYTNDFEELEEIGSGSFGSVFKCRNRVDGWLYAIKVSKRKIRCETERQKILREVYALAALGSHAHILRYYGSWIEDDQLFIQTELCEGSLSQLFESGKTFSEQELCDLLRQIASALHHLHSSNLVHLDVKPENIYVTPAEQYKIGDFGLICTADEKSFEEGDSRYMPKDLFCEFPELTKADIFSLGCSVYELTRGTALPRGGEEWSAIREGKIILPSSYSAGFQSLLREMLHPDPKKRPSAAELIQHKFLTQEKSLHEQLTEQRRICSELQRELSYYKQYVELLSQQRQCK